MAPLSDQMYHISKGGFVDVECSMGKSQLTHTVTRISVWTHVLRTLFTDALCLDAEEIFHILTFKSNVFKRVFIFGFHRFYCLVEESK